MLWQPNSCCPTTGVVVLCDDTEGAGRGPTLISRATQARPDYPYYCCKTGHGPYPGVCLLLPWSTGSYGDWSMIDVCLLALLCLSLSIVLYIWAGIRGCALEDGSLLYNNTPSPALMIHDHVTSNISWPLPACLHPKNIGILCTYLPLPPASRLLPRNTIQHNQTQPSRTYSINISRNKFSRQTGACKHPATGLCDRSMEGPRRYRPKAAIFVVLVLHTWYYGGP